MVRIYFERVVNPAVPAESFGVRLSVADGVKVPPIKTTWGCCPEEALAIWLIRNKAVVSKRSSTLRKLINAAIRLAAPDQLVHQVAARPYLLTEGLGTEVVIDGEEAKAWARSGNHNLSWVSRVSRDEFIVTWTKIKLEV